MNCLKEKKRNKKKGIFASYIFNKNNYLICVFASKPINFIRTFALLATVCMTVRPKSLETD